MAILKHVRAFWPNSVVTEEGFEGPIQESVPGFKILELASRNEQRPIIYLTLGCFASEPNEHVRHEFFFISPSAVNGLKEILSMLAHYHADKRFRLDVGSIVSIGGPWLPGSQCDHLLISLPYPYGPRLEWLQLQNVCIRFLWALPITAREAAYADLNGYLALEEKFEETKVSYQDPFRLSVV